MKITVETATGLVGSALVNGRYDIYLNEEIKGWLGLFGKLEIDDVEAGENIITIKTYKKEGRKIRFFATHDVHIWIREKPDGFSRNHIEILALGKDLKVLEEKKES